MPRPARNPWKNSWKVMEAVSRQFKISATTFHITSTRPMSRYYFPHLGSRTTACHMASSSSFPSPNTIWIRSTTLPQLEVSAGVLSLISSFPSLPVLSVPSIVLPSVGFSCSASASSFYFLLAATSHPLRCSSRILEGPR